MFTVLAYRSNVQSSTFAYVTPLEDQHLRVEGYNVIVPEDLPNLGAVWGIGSNLQEVRIETPSLRRTVLLDVPSVTDSGLPTFPIRWYNRFYNPIPLDAGEPMRAQAIDTGSGDTENETVVIFLTDGAQSPVQGDIITVKATVSKTLTADVWTSGALEFEQTLPVGTYQVVGARVESPTLVVARFIFVGQAWRPGVIGVNAHGQLDEDIFRYGNLGVFGEFAHDQPPTVEFLANSADVSETVYLDLIKTS